MAFYYVKSGGTATGDAGRSETARTGSFANMGASSYYASVYDVFGGGIPTTAPDGDIVKVSNTHTETHASIVLGLDSATNYKSSLVISVLDNDVTAYSKGASITCTSGTLDFGSAVNFKSGFHVKGFVIDVTNSHIDGNNAYSRGVFDDCTINGSSTTNLNFTKCELVSCITTGKLLYGSYNTFKGGALIVTWSYLVVACLETVFQGVDLSGSAGSSKLSYGSNIKLINCKLDTFPPVKYGTWRPADFVEFIGCDTGNGYHHYAAHSFGGEVFSDELIHFNYSYDGTNKSSIAINSNSFVNVGDPLQHKLCELPAQDLATTDKTYRVNLLLDTATAATLTDSDFWVELSHNDNTDLALGKVVSSRNTDILAAGTELTVSSEVWQGTLPATNKTYQVDITLSAASLTNVTNGNVIVYVNLAVPNCDVYVCPAVQIGT